MERDQVEGLTDEMTIGQLAGLLYEVDSQGRMKIESKERARERGVPSPDRAEALMLALGKPSQKMEVFFLRDLPYLRAKAAGESSSPDPEHPYWGFREIPYTDDDDNRVRVRRWPRGWEGFLMHVAIEPRPGDHNPAEFEQGTGSVQTANSTIHSLPLQATAAFSALRARRGGA